MQDRGPQFSVWLFETQLPRQSCWVGSMQVLLHGLVFAMQVPAHGRIPSGQWGTQVPASQAAVPPTGALQTTQDAVQCLGSESEKQPPSPHRW